MPAPGRQFGYTPEFIEPGGPVRSAAFPPAMPACSAIPPRLSWLAAHRTPPVVDRAGPVPPPDWLAAPLSLPGAHWLVLETLQDAPEGLQFPLEARRGPLAA